MITIDKELERFLFPSIQENQRPQRVFAANNKRALLWLPGKETVDTEKVKWAVSKGELTGYTGLVYERDAANKFDKYSISFIGIDIDDCIEYEKIKEKLPNYSIRYSKSKTGLHLIQRIEPIEVPVDTNMKDSIKATMRDDIDTLTSIGVPVCCYGNNAFYFANHGWIHRSDKIVKLQLKEGVKTKRSGCKPNYTMPLCAFKDGDMKNLIEIFIKNEIISSDGNFIESETSVWVKQVYQALKGTIYQFNTSSPMKSTTWEINGLIKITPDIVSLYTHASKQWTTIWVSF